MAASHSKYQLTTSDVVLAAVLVMEGFNEYELTELDEDVRPGHPKGAWVFTVTPRLEAVVKVFYDGRAAVEPQGFETQLKATRREMFAYLGIGT
jgi:hypothetical protein